MKFDRRIADRRKGERRKNHIPIKMDRRRGERRFEQNRRKKYLKNGAIDLFKQRDSLPEGQIDFVFKGKYGEVKLVRTT